MAVKIRHATNNDCQRVMEILNSIVSEREFISVTETVTLEQVKTWHQDNIREGKVFLVVELNGNVVGSVILAPNRGVEKHVGYVRAMGVMKEYRRKGGGTQLMKRVFKEAEKKGLRKLTLEVRSNNMGAINFYRKQGFEIEGILKKHIFVDGDYFDRVYMSKFLKPEFP